VIKLGDHYPDFYDVQTLSYNRFRHMSSITSKKNFKKYFCIIEIYDILSSATDIHPAGVAQR
jgi:hypothetical protein